MSDIASPPTWAPVIWTDGLDIFAQFPAGHVLRYPLTDGGLQRVLKLIPNVKAQPGYTPFVADKLLRREPRLKPARASSQERKQIASSTTPSERAAIKRITKGLL